MPRDEALKAKYLFAVVACNLSVFLWCCFDHNIVAFGIWTEFFQVAPHHFLVSFKLSKLFICGLIANNFYELVRHWGCAPTLGTFNEKPFVSRLCNLIGKEITVAIFTEGMATACIHNKVTIVVLFIANLAKFRIHYLLRLYKQLIFQVIFRLFLWAYQ